MQISDYMLLNTVSDFFFNPFTVLSSSYQAHNAVFSEQEHLTKLYSHCHTKRPNNFQKSCKTQGVKTNLRYNETLLWQKL